MRQEEIVAFQRRQPFRPFRIRLRGGAAYEVLAPGMALAAPWALCVGIPGPGGTAADEVVSLPLEKVMALEYIAAPPAAAGAGG
ncbi:MAG: hypothetical protein ACRC33_18905 [Gemmataceae bacterium]